MKRVNRLDRWAWLACLAACAGGLLLWPGGPRRRGEPGVLLPGEGWDVPRAARHLAARGLKFHLVPAEQGGTGCDRAYLTTTERTWEELDRLPKTVESLTRWQGVVYGERVHQPGALAGQVRLWGGCCLDTGPLLFFGDPDLLARISAALQQPEPR
jgi:hypothetical protein